MNASPPAPEHALDRRTRSSPPTASTRPPSPCPSTRGARRRTPTRGGDWVFDASGNPVLQRMEEANFVVTIPRQPMPAAGYPTVVLSRTGAGGNRPLVDRGVAATNGGPPIMPGTRPGPLLRHGRLRRLRDRRPARRPAQPHQRATRTSPSSTSATPSRCATTSASRPPSWPSRRTSSTTSRVDVSDCPGAVAPGNMARFDTGTMALMGHSMGATISPLTLAFEPRFQVGLLSGCGRELDRERHLQAAPGPRPRPRRGPRRRRRQRATTSPSTTRCSPSSSGRSSPPTRRSTRAASPSSPRRRARAHVLMMQGIVDHYIMPPIADATSLSLGLDLAGPELDDHRPRDRHARPGGPLPPPRRQRPDRAPGLRTTSSPRATSR